MTGSPFSNVVGHNPGDNTTWYKQGETTQVSDTTTETGARPQTDGSESSVGVETDGLGNTHEAAQDETQGQTDLSGTNVTGT